MASMPDLATNLANGCGGGELLPLSPFDSLNYHFGMLLGVDDFETEQAYHRAKMRMHNAWLHRQGVVWGFGVTVDNDRGEIRVTPGLALDAAGHELHLDGEYCINVGKWFDERKKDPDFTLVPEGFEAHVVICFKACLQRQVPALLEPCDNGSTGTAYSRVRETLEIRLLPSRAPVPVYPYHLLRLMFGIDAPRTLEQTKLDELKALESSKSITPADQVLLNAARADQEVLDEVQRIQALPVAQQAAEWLKAFHRFAALDEIDLRPATSADGARTLLFPGQENDCVVLADVTELVLAKKDNQWVLSGGKVDTSVRPSHVATTTIQDLLCGRLIAASESQAEDTGPRVNPASVNLSVPNVVMLTLDKEILEASINPNAFSVTWFNAAEGWHTLSVVSAEYGGGETKTIKLELGGNMNGRVRLIVFGTGPSPLVGIDMVPLAGAVGGPPGTPHDGRDFVYMKDYVRGETESGDETEPAELSEIVSGGASGESVRDEGNRRSSSKLKIRRSKSVK